MLTLIPLLTLVGAMVGRTGAGRAVCCACQPGTAAGAVALLLLQYANPMLGGPWVAQQVPLGWGGVGAMVRWLNRHAGASVMTGNVPGTAVSFAGSTIA